VFHIENEMPIFLKGILVQSKNKHQDYTVQTTPKEHSPSWEVTVAEQHNALPMVYVT
jgi:hypothetical protein